MPLYGNEPFTQPCLLDYDAFMTRIDLLAKKYPFIRIGSIGNSVLGRSIPLLTIGSGARRCLYVATHHAMEWITSLVLLRFVNEFCESIDRHTRIGAVYPHYIAKTYTIYVVPMLNPDGVNYQIHGLDIQNPLRERVLKMNGGSEDFTHWQANARGVDLNHNYNAGFWEYKELEKENGIENGACTKYSGEAPESEPETASLCNFIGCSMPLDGVLSLHTQGEEIFYHSKLASSKTSKIAKSLASLCGYKLSCATGSAAYGGLTDWCIESLKIPCFTIECGKGKNPLQQTQFSSIYCRLRQMLFSFPSLL